MLGALDTAPGSTRLHTGALLHEWGLTDFAETAELVVSELVTNAVQASTGPDGKPRYERPESGLPIVRLRLLSDRRCVVIEVWDQSPREPVARQAALDDQSGRGLMLVDALCVRWDWKITPGRPGKVVCAELRA